MNKTTLDVLEFNSDIGYGAIERKALNESPSYLVLFVFNNAAKKFKATTNRCLLQSKASSFWTWLFKPSIF